ncbi:hypothetical protein [Streptomyces canus]|uniref:hypothetical protein n=1 Tax=Streptomyces canus TaxID=58343 RepID=UPI002E2CB434|nr:hypothetical protein [Streptomyces canus]
MGSEVMAVLVDGRLLLALAAVTVGALKVWLQYRKAVVRERGRTARLRVVLHTVRPELRADVITAYASLEAAGEGTSDSDA